MKQVAIITDSNSGITQAQAKELGIQVLPMPFYIEEQLYFEDITLTQEEFYAKLQNDANISTSQPSPGDVMDLWDTVLQEYEEVVHIPMSSGLSSSCETAISLSEEYHGKVHVVNNKRISVTQRQAVMDAIQLVAEGKTAAEVKQQLEAETYDASIYVTVDTLKYLKKGGRITPAAAAIGTVLNLKPVLQVQGDKLDAYAKVRGWKQAKKTMLDALEKDMLHRFGGQPVTIHAAYTTTKEEAMQWKAEIENRFDVATVHMDPLSLSVACHVGPGSLAVACTKNNR